MMHATKISTVLGLGAGATAITWLILRFLAQRGEYLPPVSWLVPVAVLIMAGLVLLGGLRVRAYQQGKRPQLDPLWAVRIVSWAKASVLAGAVLCGGYLAQLLAVLPDIQFEAQQDRAWRAGAAVVAAVGLAVAGWLTERWCKLPPPEAQTKTGSDENPEETTA